MDSRAEWRTFSPNLSTKNRKVNKFINYRNISKCNVNNRQKLRNHIEEWCDSNGDGDGDAIGDWNYHQEH